MVARQCLMEVCACIRLIEILILHDRIIKFKRCDLRKSAVGQKNLGQLQPNLKWLDFCIIPAALMPPSRVSLTMDGLIQHLVSAQDHCNTVVQGGLSRATEWFQQTPLGQAQRHASTAGRDLQGMWHPMLAVRDFPRLPSAQTKRECCIFIVNYVLPNIFAHVARSQSGRHPHHHTVDITLTQQPCAKSWCSATA